MSARPEPAPLGHMLLRQTWGELLIRWRLPAFSATNLVLPVVLFSFFGLPFAGRMTPSGLDSGALLLASFGAYAVGQVMVYGFGIGVAVERGQRVDVLARATPLPPSIYLAAKIVVGMVFGLLSVLVLFTYGAVVGGIRLAPEVWVNVIARLLAGSLPLIALGFSIGYTAGPNAAPAVANLVYLPLAFASGIFLPLEQLPAFIQRVAPYLPTYHYAQLAWNAVGGGREPLGTSVAWLAGYTVVFLWTATRAYRLEAQRKFA
ncbi:MAG: ABC transporter permease [Candidatus Rokuibacteriota bacterium]